MKIIHKTVFLVLFASLSLAVRGQPTGRVAYSIYQEGLSQLQVTKLCEDRRGRIWVGTMDGLCIFNPETQSLQSPLTNPLLPLGAVREMELDRTGKLWYATIRGLFSEDGDSIALPRFTGSTAGVKFCFDAQNRLWYVHREERKVYCVVNQKHYALDSLLPDLQGHEFAEVRYHAISRRILLGTMKGEYFFLDEAGQRIQEFRLDSLESIKESQQNELYTFSPKGLFRIGADGSKTWVGDLPNEDWKQVRFLDISTDGTCYFGKNGHLFEVNDGKEFDFGTQFKSLREVLVSREGPIYVGTWEGLVVYHVPSFRFWGEKDNVKYPWTALQDQDGTLWYHGYGQGLFRFDSETGTFLEDTSYFDEFALPGRNREMANKHYPGSILTHNGNLLLAHGNGVLAQDNNTFRFLNSATNGGDFTVFDILEDTARQRILVASNDVVELDNQGNCRHLTKGRDALSSNYLLDLELGPHGTIWVATSDQLGYLVGDSLVEYRSADFSFPIHFDQKRFLWAAGGWGEGLWAVEPNRHHSRPIAPSFIKRFLSFIDQLDDTYLLIGAVDGLFLLRLDEYYRSGKVFLAHYDGHNGLMGQECGQSSIFHKKME